MSPVATLEPPKIELDASKRKFQEFSLVRLLKTCFGEGSGEKACVLIDLPDPKDVKGFAFLGDETLSIQNYGHEVFYKGFQNGALEAMNRWVIHVISC